jgi:alanyl-tRNA synthetase
VITSETGIGSGIRRIEALAGAAAYAYVNDLREQLTDVGSALESRPDNVVARAEQLVQELRERDKRIEQLTQQLAMREAEDLVRQAEQIGDVAVVAGQIGAANVEYLQAATDAVKSRLGSGVVALGAIIDGKPAFAMSVSRDLTKQGLNAGSILRQAAKEAQGGAGGNAEFAQGGGRDSAGLDAVLRRTVDLIRQDRSGT